MIRSSFLMLLSFVVMTANAQVKKLPTEAKVFLPAGYEMLDYMTGDLNNDKKMDAILVLKEPGEDSITEANSKRPMLILIRQANGKLKQVARNDNAIMCRHCGGSFGDPYEGLIIKPGAFELSFYGGSSWRWAYTYLFNYNLSKKNWYLVREKQVSFQSGDPDKTMKEASILASELGEVSIDQFDSEQSYDDTKWKVSVPKTYFYQNPALGGKPGKAYLLKGNIASGVRQLKNFIYVSFENAKGGITEGYILRKDLELQK